MELTSLLLSVFNTVILIWIIYSNRKESTKEEQVQVQVQEQKQEQYQRPQQQQTNVFSLVDDYLNGKGDLFNEKDSGTIKK